MTCPSWQAVARRIYSTAGVIFTSGALRRRIEQNAEPKMVKRQASEEPQSPRHSNRQFIVVPGSSVMRRMRRRLSQGCGACNLPGDA
jgi:hypothetical protein